MLMLKFMLVSLVIAASSWLTTIDTIRSSVAHHRWLLIASIVRLLVLLPARFFAHVNNADVMEL